eukprot:jgi/Mesvir1/7454/Mv19229-RA.1
MSISARFSSLGLSPATQSGSRCSYRQEPNASSSKVAGKSSFVKGSARLDSRPFRQAEKRRVSRCVDAPQARVESINSAPSPRPKVPDFPIPAPKLIELCKAFVESRFGVDNPDLLAPEFYTILPVVGPLPKDAFLDIFGGFNLRDAFPDLDEGHFGFSVDPYQPNRVWYFSRGVGTHAGSFQGIPPTGRVLQLVPTASAVVFNEQGKAIKFSTGYPVDREEGNTGGMSALFGILYFLKPSLLSFIPEGRPYKPSWQFLLLQKIGALGRIITAGRKD